MIFSKKIMFFISVLFLCSCGGSDDSDDYVDNNIDSNSYAFTEIIYEKYGNDRIVDLSNQIGKKGKISKVISRSSDDCIKVDSDTKIIASSVENRLCTAEIFFDSNKNKGVISISSSDSDDNTFDIISKTMVSNDSINIEMSDELGADFPKDFVLDSELVIIGSATAVSDPITNTIQVTSSSDDDISRIIYMYKSLTSDETIQGLLLVSNSLKANNIPTAESYQLSGNVGDEIEVDLQYLINDLDSDDNLQLIDLYSLSGYEFIKDEDLLNNKNKKFYFKPEKQGEYDVFYVVSDHRGGIASNVIRFKINGYSSFKPIYVESLGNVFYPPKLIDDVEGVYDFSSIIEEDGTFGPKGFSFPTFNKDLAQLYCNKQGLVLPTLEQMFELFKQEQLEAAENTIFMADNWPSTAKYISSNGSINLQNGISSSDTDLNYYVSCVGLSLEALEIPIHVASIQSGHVKLYALGHYSDGTSSVYQKPLFWEIVGGEPDIISLDEKTGDIEIHGIGDVVVKVTNDDNISATTSIRIIDNLLAIHNGVSNGFDPSFDSYASCFSNYNDIVDDFFSYIPYNNLYGGVNLDDPKWDDYGEFDLVRQYHDKTKSNVGVYNSACMEYGNNNAYFKLYSSTGVNSTTLLDSIQRSLYSLISVKNDFLNDIDYDNKVTFSFSYDAVVNIDDFTESIFIDDKHYHDYEVKFVPPISISVSNELYPKNNGSYPIIRSNFSYSVVDGRIKITNSAPTNRDDNKGVTFRDDLGVTTFNKINNNLFKVHAEVFFDYEPARDDYFDEEELLDAITKIKFYVNRSDPGWVEIPDYAAGSMRIDNMSLGIYEVN
ncbi:hypothetical protein NGM67_03290 [Photobacterium damselae]|uniref:hypothetical protein n=1 Tax=Photobacterium damselae TaxID=38293 RepID=UPI0020917E7E|nr:hypothetical protein [Photobacterium damselae]USR75073.1 hypothetical protein NGM67_03290 [Photobacterium damselae]